MEEGNGWFPFFVLSVRVRAGMTKLVDVADLNSAARFRAYGFDPRFRHHPYSRFFYECMIFIEKDEFRPPRTSHAFSRTPAKAHTSQGVIQGVESAPLD